MCRLIAFPPNFSQNAAIEAMLEFEGPNQDGVGSVYIKNGEFVVQKYPLSLTEILDNDIEFLSHMPCDSWTVAHLRLASHGPVNMVNTHPFLVGPWAVVHNGCWSDYKPAKIYNEDRLNLIGDTDSEVAANMINILGPEKFIENITGFSGVFLALNLDGTLWALKSSGDLEIHEMKNGVVLLGSTLKDYKNNKEALNGWYHFDKNAKYIDGKQKKSSFINEFDDDGEIDWRSNYHGVFRSARAVTPTNQYKPIFEKPIAGYDKKKKGKIIIKTPRPWYAHKEINVPRDIE